MSRVQNSRQRGNLNLSNSNNNIVYRAVLCTTFREYIDYKVKSPTLLFIISRFLPNFVVVSSWTLIIQTIVFVFYSRGGLHELEVTFAILYLSDQQ